MIFPRLKSRGPIEARWTMGRRAESRTFPRLKSRDPIEACGYSIVRIEKEGPKPQVDRQASREIPPVGSQCIYGSTPFKR